MGERVDTHGLRQQAGTDDDPVAVIRDDASGTTATPALHRISWLAAYVVGLASTNRDDQTCVEQIVDIHASPAELRGAHGMLAGWDMQGTARHRRALRLTEQAIASTDPHRSSRTPARDHRWVTEWSR